MKEELKGSAYIMQLLGIDIVKDAETAIELTEVLIRRKYGKEALKLQQPLSANDVGDRWIISGRSDALNPSDQLGPIHTELMKVDARVTAFNFTLPQHLRQEFEKTILSERKTTPQKNNSIIP